MNQQICYQCFQKAIITNEGKESQSLLQKWFGPSPEITLQDFITNEGRVAISVTETVWPKPRDNSSTFYNK
jgi:hypothetical protein